MDDPLALLIADVLEAAGVMRRWGEQTSALEGQTQARFQLLSVLSDEAMAVPAAAGRLGVSRQAVQRVANDLLAEGLLALQSNDHHRSSPLLALTDEGHRTLARIAARARSAHQAVADDLEAAHLEDARRVLRAVVTRVRPHLGRD